MPPSLVISHLVSLVNSLPQCWQSLLCIHPISSLMIYSSNLKTEVAVSIQTLALVFQNSWHHIQGDPFLNIYLARASSLTLICSSIFQVLYPNRIHGMRLYLRTVFCYMEIGVFHCRYKPNSYSYYL
jgi:hypothetical protein